MIQKKMRGNAYIRLFFIEKSKKFYDNNNDLFFI